MNYKKTGIRIGIMVIIAVAIEVFFFNFRTFQSMFYMESNYKSYDIEIEGAHPVEGMEDTYSMDADEAILHIRNIGYPVENIRVDLENVNAIDLPYLRSCGCNVTVVGGDEYMIAQLSTDEVYVMHQIPESQYLWFMSKGNVNQLALNVSMDSGYMFQIHDITLNAKRPLLFSWVRCLLVFLGILFFYAFRKNSLLWTEDCIKLQGWKKAIIFAIIFGFAGIGLFLTLKNAAIAFCEDYVPYQELARAFDAGQVSLLDTPPQELVELSNPYDLTIRQMNGFGDQKSYRFDYVMYNGKYYVYFGVVPCLMFYWPLYHWTGLNMPNAIPILFYSLMFCFGALLLLREIIRRFYPKTPFAMLLLMQLSMMFGCQLPYFMTQGDSYIVPIISAIAFTIWGLYFWISSRIENPKKIITSRLLLGSLCMALVAGCRPTTVIYSFLAIPIFWDYLKVEKKGYTSKCRLQSILTLLLPYFVVAIGLMYYNKIRFGSPFEFGTKYTLTLLNLNGTGFELDRVLTGIYNYLLQLPCLNYRFPFITLLTKDKLVVNNWGHGLMFVEGNIGGLFPCNLFLLSIIGLYPLRKKNVKKELFVLCNMILAFVVLLIVFSTSYTGCMIYRYFAEISSPLFLVAFITIMAMQEQYEGKEYYEVFRKVFLTTIVMALLYNSCQFIMLGTKFVLIDGNTSLFYKIFYGFNFW